MKKLLIVALIMIAGSYSNLQAQKPGVVVSDKKGWHKIGETSADFKQEKDEISVLGADRFAKLKFVISNASVDLQSMTVFYENGTTENVSIMFSVKAPGESRVIDLKGTESSLKKVQYVYKSVANAKDKKAHVELWGLKTNEVK